MVTTQIVPLTSNADLALLVGGDVIKYDDPAFGELPVLYLGEAGKNDAHRFIRQEYSGQRRIRIIDVPLAHLSVPREGTIQPSPRVEPSRTMDTSDCDYFSYQPKLAEAGLWQ